jgi:hypothetical protein
MLQIVVLVAMKRFIIIIADSSEVSCSDTPSDILFRSHIDGVGIHGHVIGNPPSFDRLWRMEGIGDGAWPSNDLPS